MGLKPEHIQEIMDHLRSVDTTFEILDWIEDNVKVDENGDFIYKGEDQPEPQKDGKEFDGYKQAQVFDELLAKLYLKYPLTDENRLQWLNFTRTITTDLDIISKDCMKPKKDDSPKCPNCGAKVVHVAEHIHYADNNKDKDTYVCEKRR